MAYPHAKMTHVFYITVTSHDHRDVNNHKPLDRLPNSSLRLTSKKTSKVPVTGTFLRGIHRARWIPLTKANNAESISMWWRRHERLPCGEQGPFVSSITNAMAADVLAIYKAKTFAAILLSYLSLNIRVLAPEGLNDWWMNNVASYVCCFGL